jgi:glycosyltransferase involved in cell wall biosynthesis
LTTILHVLDHSAGEVELAALQALLVRLPPPRFQHVVCSTTPLACRAASSRLKRHVHLARERFNTWPTAGPRLRAIWNDSRADLAHAWGIGALATCCAAGLDRPVVFTHGDPATAAEAARWLRQARPAPVIAANSQIVRRRLVERGTPYERVVVIRGGVDFGAINEARQAGIRQHWTGDGAPILLTTGPARRAGGQFEAVWCAAILRHLHPATRIIVPFESPETKRLRRLARNIGMDDLLITPGDRLRWSELVAAADVMIAAPHGDMPGEALAWAMAAGVPIVAAARHSVAELIADHHNGLLCRTHAPVPLTRVLLRLLEDDGLRRRLVETARSQAYEVFSLRSFADNYAALYNNILNGRAISEGIQDTAMAG